MKTTERGYFKLDTPEGVKYAHFSRTFLSQLKVLFGTDIMEIGKKLVSPDSFEDKFDGMAALVHAGLNAYALEEDLEITWNEHKVGNWLWEAMNESDEVIVELDAALQNSLPPLEPQAGKK